MKNWARKNKIFTGQLMSLGGLCGLLFLTTTSGFVKSAETANYVVLGWICGGLTVGGIAFVMIKELEEKIEKFRNLNEQNGEGKS